MRILDFADGFESAVEPTSVSFPASKVSNSPSGNLSSTTVQGAVNELQGDIDTINNKIGAANGIASLDSNGKVPVSQIPALALVDVYQVADIPARDALSVEEGDVAVVANAGSGVTKTYVYGGSGWVELISDGSLAAHIANTSNPHSVTKTQIGLSNVDNTSDATKNAATATLTNKTLTSPVLTTPTTDVHFLTEQSSSPATPSAGTKKFYAKTDGKVYTLNSAGTEVEVGAGSSSGINYITHKDGTAIGSWTTYSDGASSSPTDGTGGSPASTYAVSTDSSMRGTTNFLWTHSAANRQGEGFSYNFTIDPSDKGKVLQISVEYLIASGTYADDDLQFWIFDRTNNTLIQPAPFKLKNSGIIEKFAMEFQTSSNSTSYRLIGHVATSTATAYAIRFTNWSLGPQAKLYGSSSTESVSYTGSISYGATVATNVTSQTYKQSRNGDKLTVSGNVAFNGAANANGNFRLPLPSGLSIDTTKISSAYQIVGFVVGYFNSSKQFSGHIRVDGGSTSYVSIQRWDDSGANDISWAGNTTAGSNIPAGVAMANGDGLSFTFTVPIVGWSSSQVMSNDAATTIIGARYTNTAGTSFTSGVEADLPFATKDYDDVGAFASPTYTVKVPGRYKISAKTKLQAAVFNGAGAAIRIRKNGSNVSTIASFTGTSASSLAYGLGGFDILDLVAGDTIVLRFISDTTVSLSTTAGDCSFTIAKESGPSQIAASDTMSASYTGLPTGTLTNSFNITTFPTKRKDTHGKYSSGSYTIDSPGEFDIHAQISVDATHTTATSVIVSVFVDNVEKARTRAYTYVSGSFNLHPQVHLKSIPLLAGQVVSIRSYCDATTPSFNANTESHQFSIKRTGNY